MFKVKERGLKVKVVNRNLIVENIVYNVDNILLNFKLFWLSKIIDKWFFGFVIKLSKIGMFIRVCVFYVK